MKLLENFRNFAFWSLDFLNGAKVTKHYKEIKFITENYSSPKAKSILDKNLSNILTHAVNNTQFYKKKAKYSSLNDFSVINKNVILDNIDKFKSNLFINKNSKQVSTSGSTGVPLKMIHDANKKHRNTADNIYFSESSGFKVGYKLLYIRHWRAAHMKSSLLSWIQNIQPIEIVNLNDEYIEQFIKAIQKDSSNIGIVSYASGLEVICKYLDKVKSKPINGNIKSIIAMSEALNNYTKQGMKKYFNVVTVSRYSNMENGLLAIQKMDNSHEFKINWASYFIEILKFDEDKPAGSGQMGRIVVTDLFNYAMPMIRYDTGDIGSINYNETPPVFEVIEGRKSDVILKTNGEILSSFVIAEVNSFSGIKQSQLIQETKKHYKLILNVELNFNYEIEIKEKFKSFLGDDAEVLIEYVNEIPILNSGKRKTTLNKYLEKTKN